MKIVSFLDEKHLLSFSLVNMSVGYKNDGTFVQITNIKFNDY